MIELYEKLQDKEWEIINKADEKSDILGMVAAAGIGLAEGLVIAVVEVTALRLVSKVILAIKGRR